ncbi:hypothetical protein PT974_11785 [Cladobotryum mycophilum]|uniref:Uncharacterized protein n=1 Tax=Cladobotryum mycophilum TaxID=491253 RepID=A0ABR0S660_9HYPO
MIPGARDNSDTIQRHLDSLRRIYTEHQSISPDTDPVPQKWPSSYHVDMLSTRLASVARSTLAAQPHKPLDQHLRDEMQRVWISPAFLRSEPNAEQAFRLILAATYTAIMKLGLPVQNAARDWLCDKERVLREQGYEPMKSRSLTNFLQDVGVRYLEQA